MKELTTNSTAFYKKTMIPTQEWPYLQHLLPIETNNHINDKAISESAELPEMLVITSYPPRECGIATYSQDLIKALNSKFINTLSIKICALETTNEKHIYRENVEYTLNAEDTKAYYKLADSINSNRKIKLVLIQHEFGFFNNNKQDFVTFLCSISKPIIIVFHTVLPISNASNKRDVLDIIDACTSIVVMTNNSAKILVNNYQVPEYKINVIPHGTHLVPHLDKVMLKEKYALSGRKIVSTFGLLSSGKGIETTLNALPEIIIQHPDIMFLIIGKTHPTVVKNEGEIYRRMLENKVHQLQLENNVCFVNKYINHPDLLEYLQLTDVYLFTSKDPNQAVSGTFSYAISCGCPIVSTPMPHALEVLNDGAGIIIDFDNVAQLSKAVINLLNDEALRINMSNNGLHKIAATAWENTAIAHALLIENTLEEKINLHYKLPSINLDHLKRMTTSIGLIQFAKINQPDSTSGYTLDDNARAMIAMCQHYEITRDKMDITYITKYLNFINDCIQPDGYFLNYINDDKLFTEQNNTTNLSDANGRAIWALGYLISFDDILPLVLIKNAELILQEALLQINTMHATRAMAFVIKGIYYYNLKKKSDRNAYLLAALADRLVQMYKHESVDEWAWFESYLTYANSVLPEAMLCAYLETGNDTYKEIALTSLDFLLYHTFSNDGIKVISNKSWLQKGEASANFGEQPIDVAYTILCLSRFYDAFGNKEYLQKMELAFDWFLGKNHLHQIIYNPCTGGCYDGLEENYVNLNQGAESTVSYLMARLTVEKYLHSSQKKSALSIPFLKLNEEVFLA